MRIEEGLCYDDVLLAPQYSDIESRKDVSLTTTFCGVEGLPIISANMDTITGPEMVKAMSKIGGFGILHRYADYDTVCDWIRELEENSVNLIIPSIGIKAEDYDKAMGYKALFGINSICIDVAHGHCQAVLDMIKKLKDEYTHIIAGNVATREGFNDLAYAGATVVKIGVGPGSVCQTRDVSGHGVPQLSAIVNSTKDRGLFPKVQIIADGGLRTSGDMVKSFAAGADLVMIGGLLSGTDETPLINGKRIFRGMASREAQTDFKGSVSNNTPEGTSLIPSAKGPVSGVIEQLAGGIRSGLTYSGCRDIKELQQNAKFIKISTNCLAENSPHGIGKL